MKTGVYQAQHRLLMEIFRNPDASQNDIARSMDVVCGNNSGIPEKVGERGIYQKRDGLKRITGFNKITITEKGNKVVEQKQANF